MARYQRANSAAVEDFPAPANACSSTTLLGVERAVEGEQGLIAAEEPRIRRPRHPAPRARSSAVCVGGGELDQRRVALLRAPAG